MQKIFITGASGMVGSRFVELYKDKYEIIAPNRPEFDLTNLESVEKYFKNKEIDAVIHFAAYTNVSESENQRNDENGDCWKINVLGTENLVKNVDSQKCHFIHISTDYVFPGSEENPGPYPEDKKPEEDSSKVTWYGYTKKVAEDMVNKYLGGERTILRLIYPVRTHFPEKLDYLRKPLSLFDQGKLYPMFKDQQVSITFIDEACLALEKIIEEKILGVYHASTSDTSTPYELVSYLIEKARGVKDVVKESSLDEFIKTSGSSPVRYPKYGGLKVEQTEKILGIKFSSWRELIDKLINQGLN